MNTEINILQILIPLVCSTVLFTGVIMFTVLIIATREKVYISLVGFALCGFTYVFCEILVVMPGIQNFGFSLGIQFFRIQQLAGAFFLFVIPLFLYYFENYSGKTGRVIRVLILFGLFFSLLTLLIAYIQPDYFVSISKLAQEKIANPADYGRISRGFLYTVRDILLGIYLVILISASCYKISKKARFIGYKLPVYLGLIIGSYLSLDDLLSVYLNRYIDFLYNFEFQRFPVAITILIVLSMIAVFIRFIEQSIEVVKIKNQLIHRAYHDPLTNLKNRKAFYSFIKTPGKLFPRMHGRAVSGAHDQPRMHGRAVNEGHYRPGMYGRAVNETPRGQKEKNKHDGGLHALILIFLTNFIEINETNGHEVGDKLLNQVTEKLIGIIKDKDRIFKISGSEYSVLFFNTNYQNIKSIAQQVVALSMIPFLIKDEILYLEIAVGIRFFSTYMPNYETIVQHAGYSLLKAKSEKNSYSFFSHKLKKEVSRKLKIISRLKNAVKNDEMFMVYQPKVNYEGQVVGAEALLRWKNKDLGTVPPALFIPYAEETGLIIPIGYHLFKKVCADIVTMQEKGIIEVPIAVNISPKQFREPHLIENLSIIMDSYSIPLSLIHIEITETSLIEKWDAMHDTLSAFYNKGIQISIDDFGTGYSSLGYLKDLPVHTVKIDRSFVTGLPDNKKDGVIVQSIIKMIQGLGYSLVAEGVEEKKQLDFLYDNNCKTYQGYYFSKPLLLDDFISYVLSSKSKKK